METAQTIIGLLVFVPWRYKCAIAGVEPKEPKIPGRDLGLEAPAGYYCPPAWAIIDQRIGLRYLAYEIFPLSITAD